MNENAILYRQVKLLYDSIGYEVCWIPDEFAKTNKKLIIGSKDSGKKAIVTDVYTSIDTKSNIELNRSNPLREATDI